MHLQVYLTLTLESKVLNHPLFNFSFFTEAMMTQSITCSPLWQKDTDTLYLTCKSLSLLAGALLAGAHLERGVDPDGSIEQDVVAELLEQWCPVCQTVQILCKGEELL